MSSSLRALSRAMRRTNVLALGRTASTQSQASIDAFMKNFEAHKTSPTMEPPSTTSMFAAKPAMEEQKGTPDKMKLNFYLPHDAPFDKAEVDMVLVPATTGDFGVLPGHVPTVSQLRPGVVSVHVNDKDVRRYFVAGGFAFVHADSTTDICAIEAVPVEQLDPEAVKKGLAEHQAKFASAKDDFEKAHAQIGIDCCNAMVSAIEGK